MKFVFLTILVLILFASCKNNTAIATNSAGIVRNMDATEAQQLVATDKNVVILDVRTPSETNKGVIPNAVIIDYRNSDFDNQIAKLDKEKTYLVYCKSGGRSAGACDKMNKAGFKNVVNLKDGYANYLK